MFKIVSTRSKGRVELSTVPASWENNGKLYWPKKNGELLCKNPAILPQPDWNTYKCTLKRNHFITFEEAEEELSHMLNRTDTDDTDYEQQQDPRVKTSSRISQNKDFNSMAQILIDSTASTSTAAEQQGPRVNTSSCISQNKDFNPRAQILIDSAASTITAAEQQQGPRVNTSSCISQNKDFNPRSQILIDSTASTSTAAEHVVIEAQGMDGEIYTVIQNSPGRANTQQLSTAQVSYVNDQPTISNELLVVVLQNQDKIMKRLAEISVQLEEIKENKKTFVTTLGEATGSQKEKFIIEPIKNVNELERFNNQLSNFDTFESLLEKYYILCSASKGSGFNCAYRLLDALFSKDFLCKCSWTGGSRGSDVKIGFKAYKNVIKFFFEMVNSWDPSYTVENNEDFLKSVLRNALKRKGTKNIRKSSKKSKKTIKAKNVNLETDKNETQNNNKTNVDETQSNNKACEDEIQNNNNANPGNVKVGELITNNQHDYIWGSPE